MSLDVTLDRESANDESATIVAVHVACGETVETGQALFDIETAKAVQEIAAPAGGVFIYDFEVGTVVRFGAPVARILDPGETLGSPAQTADAVFAPQTGTPESPPDADGPAPVRFSRAAAALMQDLGIPTSNFSSGFVTTADLRPASPNATPIVGALRSATDEAPAARRDDAEPVSPSKRREIEMLSTGAGRTMLSVLGAEVGPLEISRASGDLLSGGITDLVIYEASRLMRKYPKLNAAYEDGAVRLHGAVHAGLAIDAGDRLLVYGVENSDRAGLPELAATIADAVARCAAHQLTPAELTRATFTVTDLSAYELGFMLPLLPRGQSCILGITRDGAGGYRLFAGFDHRVSAGAEVAAFLGELRDRLVSFAPPRTTQAKEAGCYYCGRTPREAVVEHQELGLLRILNKAGEEALCCASCWNGW